jgi:TonB-linked SusC/RagA family outer membrane protein
MTRFILYFTLLFIAINAYSQERVVKGKVYDTNDKTPLPFVSIVSQTGGSTISNSEGAYEIKVSSSDKTLIFSFLGYKTRRVDIENENIINVGLSPEASSLNEVVITAFGVKRESKELGYATQKLDSKEVTNVKTVNFLDNIAGKIAGVNITQGGTGVGSSSKITIRGESSFSNNNPLFIVDGTPINNESVFNFTNEAAAGFQEIDFGNGAMSVNPDDVESITVLKGANAAALYGTRASNGVIVISTKDGSNKKGLGVSINSSFFVDTALRLPDFQNKFGQGQSGQFEYVDGLGGGISDNITYSWGPRLDAGNLIPQFDSPVQLSDGSFVRGGDTALYSGLPITPTPFVSNPDNLKDFYETGSTSINNISISNAYDSGNYRISFTDLRSESIIPGVNLDRQTVFAKLNFQPHPNTAFKVSLSYINSSSDNRPSNGYGSENVNYSLVAWGPRSLNIDNLRDYWQPGLEDVQQYSFNYTFFDNPFFILYENRNSFVRDRVFGNMQFKHKLSENLSFFIRTGMDFSTETRRLRRSFSSNRFQNGGYAEHDVEFREVNTDFLLNYQNTFGDITLDFSVGGNRLDQRAYTKQQQTVNLAQPGIFSFNNAASPIEVFQFESQKRINSLYGIAKFAFKNYLFLDITGRNDWSSALATPLSVDGTSFFYPSISNSFILSEVISLPKIVSFAKLRASLAQVGNDTGAYQTSGAFVAQTPFNGQPTFSNQDFMPNSDLRPERTTSFEVGTDLRFLNDRINLDFTYYNAKTIDQIISLPIAVSSGYEQQVVNGGEVSTQGLEIVLGLVPFQGTDFKWHSLFNFSTYRATIKNLPQADGRLTLAYSRIYDSANQTVWFQVEEGGRIGDIYGTGYLKNNNGEFILDDEGRFIADNNLQKLGNYNPDFTLGWSNTFNYKNWSLSFLLDWRQGGEIVSRTRALGNVGGQLSETNFRPEEGIIAQGVNQNTGLPNDIAVSAESYYRQFYDRNHEENNIYDASFLKLRQLSVGYDFKIKNGFLGLDQGADMSLALIGNNLWVATENPHFDPEQLAVQGNGFVSGVEDMSYATSRSIGIRIGLNF